MQANRTRKACPRFSRHRNRNPNIPGLRLLKEDADSRSSDHRRRARSTIPVLPFRLGLWLRAPVPKRWSLCYVITRRATRRLESGMDEYYSLWEKVSVRIQDALAAIKTVKLSGAEPREVDKLQDISRVAYVDYLERAKLGNRYLFLQRTLNHFSKALVLGYGGYMVLDRQLTPGDVVMLVAYLDRLYDPIDALSSIAVS